MKNAFGRLKKEIKKEGGGTRGKVVIATVENDIHDIGKNIVSALLESHNYEVIDLGKSIAKEDILKKALKHNPDLVALSALMTTTVKEMENVINELKSQGIRVAVIVGGAVVTKDYAESIGAYYAKNALDAVKVIDGIVNNKKIS
jgi:5-methyltetrahydrofolate--homocysteine methyltransferase